MGQAQFHVQLEALRGRAGLTRAISDLHPEDDEQHLDIDALLRELGAEGAPRAPETDAEKWGRFACASDEWAQAENAYSQAETGSSPEHRQRVGQIGALQSLADFMRKERAGFCERMRGVLIRSKHREPLNHAVRAVLNRFTLHPVVRHEISLDFDSKGILRFRVGAGADKGKQRNALSTLSTGQINAFAVTLAMVLNLSRGSNPLGFICLDGISSVFDLNNLVADAAIIRALAYAGSPELKRQILITTHHEELTTRLVPHLRPPQGYSMKVIEFTEWSRETGPAMVPYECLPAQVGSERIQEVFAPSAKYSAAG